MSYEELNEKGDWASSALIGQGIRNSDCVVIVTPNSLESIIVPES